MTPALDSLALIRCQVTAAIAALNLTDVRFACYGHGDRFVGSLWFCDGPDYQATFREPQRVVEVLAEKLRHVANERNIDLPAWLASRRAERAEAERLDRLLAGVDACCDQLTTV